MRLTEKKDDNGNNHVVEFFCMMPVGRNTNMKRKFYIKFEF